MRRVNPERKPEPHRGDRKEGRSDGEMMLLIKESHHTGSNHGALWQVSGSRSKKTAAFCGNVICDNLDEYLAENPNIKKVSKLPANCRIEHNGY